MKSSKRYYNLIVLSFGIAMCSCKKLVYIDPPISQLVTASVFNNGRTATAALLNIYQSMFNQQYAIEWQTGLLSDELTNFSNNANLFQFYSNSLDRFNPIGPWSSENYYNFIFQANAIIEAMEGNKAIVGRVAKQLTGEAKFLRAFFHLYLTICYGDIPLAVTTNYKITSTLKRTAREQVFQQIISDLKDAQSLLNNDFVTADDTTTTQERIRPTRWAATALLARAYLYYGSLTGNISNFSNAEAEASAVIAQNTQFELKQELDSVFLANSREAIWQLQTPLNGGTNLGVNTNEGANFILLGQPNYYAVSTQLLNAFEIGDRRRGKWIDSIIVGPAQVYYYPYKYKIHLDSDPSNTEEYTMMLRLTEQYLIRAEARVMQHNIAGAVADLNLIRGRARAEATPSLPNPLPDIASNISEQQALDAVLHERQVELLIEGGHRWFDLIRMGYANAIMGTPGNVCQSKGGIWKPEWQLLPIPQSEMDKNPNLSQNPDYN